MDSIKGNETIRGMASIQGVTVPLGKETSVMENLLSNFEGMVDVYRGQHQDFRAILSKIDNSDLSWEGPAKTLNGESLKRKENHINKMEDIISELSMLSERNSEIIKNFRRIL